MKKILFHLIFPNYLVINEWFFVGVSPFFGRNYTDIYFVVEIVTPIFLANI